MQRIHFALAAALSVAALAAHAETPDVSGQFAATTGNATRAQVQADLARYQKAGVNPWAIAYNPLKSFKSQKSRAEVENEYVQDRAAVQAMTSEDSGSAYLAAHQPATGTQFAGQPVRNVQ